MTQPSSTTRAVQSRPPLVTTKGATIFNNNTCPELVGFVGWKLATKAPAGQRIVINNYTIVKLMNGTLLGFNRVGDCSAQVLSGPRLDTDGNPQRDGDGNILYWTETRDICAELLVDANRLGSPYWAAYGYQTLQNVLKNKPNPFEYYKDNL